MKILVLTLSLFTLQLFSNAQTQTRDTTKATTTFVFDSLMCYDEYKALFKKKGVSELKDGMYTTVVTFRLNGTCKTYEGKARIVGGKFQTPLYIKNEKGAYVTIKSTGRTLNKNYDAYRIPLENKIVQGASPTYISNEDELVDIFLIGLLKE